MDRLPPEARAWLERAGQADEPTQAQREQADAAVRRALAPHGLGDLPAPGAIEPSTPPAGAAARRAPWRGATAVKIGLTLGGIATLSTLAVLGLRVARPEAAPSRAAPVHGAPGATSFETTVPSRVEDITAPTRVLPVPAPAPASASASASEKPSRSRARASGPSLEAEMRFVAAVDAHVRAGRFEDALALLDAQERRFQAGGLGEERWALRVLASCGRNPSARVALERDRFLREAPHSVMATRVRSACAQPSRRP